MLPSVEFYSAHSCHPLWKISIGTAGQELIFPPTQWPVPTDRKIFYNKSHPKSLCSATDSAAMQLKLSKLRTEVIFESHKTMPFFHFAVFLQKVLHHG